MPCHPNGLHFGRDAFILLCFAKRHQGKSWSQKLFNLAPEVISEKEEDEDV